MLLGVRNPWPVRAGVLLADHGYYACLAANTPPLITQGLQCPLTQLKRLVMLQGQPWQRLPQRVSLARSQSLGVMRSGRTITTGVGHSGELGPPLPAGGSGTHRRHATPCVLEQHTLRLR